MVTQLKLTDYLSRIIVKNKSYVKNRGVLAANINSQFIGVVVDNITYTPIFSYFDMYYARIGYWAIMPQHQVDINNVNQIAFLHVEYLVDELEPVWQLHIITSTQKIFSELKLFVCTSDHNQFVQMISANYIQTDALSITIKGSTEKMGYSMSFNSSSYPSPVRIIHQQMRDFELKLKHLSTINANKINIILNT